MVVTHTIDLAGCTVRVTGASEGTTTIRSSGSWAVGTVPMVVSSVHDAWPMPAHKNRKERRAEAALRRRSQRR